MATLVRGPSCKVCILYFLKLKKTRFFASFQNGAFLITSGFLYVAKDIAGKKNKEVFSFTLY